MEQKIFADLHNHTTASDGDFTPDEIVHQAKLKGIEAVGVTDHDTLNGLNDAVAAGKKYDIKVIPGVEVSIRFKRPYFTGTLHLLCYFRESMLANKRFVKDFNTILLHGRGEQLVRARVDEINNFFGPGQKHPLLSRKMQFKDIADLSCNATRRHFAIALKESFNICDSDTINTIIGNDSKAYLPSGIQLNRIADFIHTDKILAVLAHPAAGSFPGKGHYKEVLPPFEVVEKIFPQFIQAGIHGIEIYYPGHTKKYQTLLKSLAVKHNLIVTGGSDCHDNEIRPLGIDGISQSQFKIFEQALP